MVSINDKEQIKEICKTHRIYGFTGNEKMMKQFIEQIGPVLSKDLVFRTSILLDDDEIFIHFEKKTEPIPDDILDILDALKGDPIVCRQDFF